MDINEMRQWFAEERTKAQDKMTYHYALGLEYLRAGQVYLARWEFMWAREIREDWKFYNVNM